jgi:anti-sigma B factor antagonist
MDFETKTIGQAVVITICVNLDLQKSKEFEKVFLAGLEIGAPLLVVDFSATNFIDSSGIQALVVGMMKVKDRGGEIRLVLSDPQLMRIFTMLSLHKVIPIFPTLPEALK